MRHVRLVLLMVALACTQQGVREEAVLREFPITSLEGVITRSGVSLDTEITSDGNGALRIEAREPTTVRLYEVEGLDIEKARLVYGARLRSEEFAGKVYLEMWCNFGARGEFFSRALHAPLSGTTEWTFQQTPFLLEAGQNPQRVKLNIVLDGTGTVWIDEIKLAASSL